MFDVESIGLGAFKRLLSFVKNLRNFGDLSLFGKFRTLAIPAVFFGVPASVYAFDASKLKSLNLTAAELEIAAQCEENHSVANVSFIAASDKLGCACTAKIISSEIPARHLEHFQPIHAYVLKSYTLEVGGESEAEYSKNFDKVTKEGVTDIAMALGYNRDTLLTLFTGLSTVDGICETREIYKGAALEDMGQLTTWSEPIWLDETAQAVEISLRGADDVLRVATN